ncbi:MAG: Glycyl-tRNA synthetase beta subunit [Anaerosporomusa subterranea]|jgi:glycyl-tRNA synthetase beta chain|nr:Glycyl-tRNA synthetase beta subunit [Anaerosporomusa subterranea]
MTKHVLLEIGTEEIPAHFMPGALRQLEAAATALFKDQRIQCGSVRALGTPRRLTLIVRDVVASQADKQSKNKGPSVKIAFDADGQPTKAAAGFARGQGVTADQLVVEDGYVYAVVEEKGGPVAELLPKLLTDLISGLSFPKTMRWAAMDIRFVRPVRWLVALFGDAVIPLSFAGVTADRITFGHRFLSQGLIAIESVDDYLAKMASHFVMVDPEERRSVIRQQIEALAAENGGSVAIDEDLLEEVIFLVEYPTALCGEFDPAYLALPPEAVITPMREHQRYFPVLGADGKLLAKFITVRNGGKEHLEIVRHGNERVLRARLADAKFFYEEDKKTPLAERVDKLKTIVFQEGLGTLYDKSVRIQNLSEKISAELVDPVDTATVRRAAYLAKADLVTGMVNEFTELQGIMGREYALLAGESAEVAEAVFEHYLPRFAGDTLPKTTAGRIVSIADKADNITATFSRGLIPTGSQDPYALRRQALGIANILLESGLHLSLSRLFCDSMELLAVESTKRTALLNDILEFFRIRLKGVLADKGVRYDLVDSVMAVGIDDVCDVLARANALTGFAEDSELLRIVQAFTRVANLAKNASTEEIQPELFAVNAEKTLHDAVSQVELQLAALLSQRDYLAMLRVMSQLVEPIDLFFNSVMVMAEDPAVRANRLALLKKLVSLTTPLADLSKIVV